MEERRQQKNKDNSKYRVERLNPLIATGIELLKCLDDNGIYKLGEIPSDFRIFIYTYTKRTESSTRLPI